MEAVELVWPLQFSDPRWSDLGIPILPSFSAMGHHLLGA
jgi:hypothetical protein